MVDVESLCANAALGLRAVSCPDLEAELRWVATSELTDPTPFLEGGELLLTTGLATKGWRREWDGYVTRLVEARVSALGLGVGLTHRTVPAALVRACEQRGLNLVEVPRRTPFVAVSRSVAELLQRRAEAEARAALDMQRRLTAAAVRPDARRSLVTRLADILDGAASLLTVDGRIAEPPSGPRRHLLDLDAVRLELARLRPLGRHAAANVGTSEASLVLVPIGLSGRPTHYLAAAMSGRVSESRRSAVTTAVALLSLAAEQDRDRVASRRRLVERALSFLSHGDVTSAGLLTTAADGPTLPAPLQVVHAAGSEDALEDALARLEEAGLLAATVDGELWLAAAPSDVVRHLEDLDGLRVGVGRAVDPAESADAHRTAALALEQATTLAPVVLWEDFVGTGPMALIEPRAAAAFSDSFLAGLDDEQVQTLASFVRNHGSRLRVAADLAVHRNTVRNRLEAIEAVLGRSLDDPASRASAWLALRVRLDSEP